jgi:2-polyprenyl-3-methyl-5-hydroxy-6-metoxy-1,4-benzoquinol methylase
MADIFCKAYEVVSSTYVNFIINFLVRHKVSQALLDSPKTIEELVYGTELNSDRLHRILLLVESKGYFSFDNETKKWSNTPESLILSDPAYSLVITHYLRPFYIEGLFHLDGLITTEKNMFELRGLDKFFVTIKNIPGYLEEFQDLMQTFTRSFSKEVIEKIDLSNSQKVLDIGGGNGSLVSELASKYPIDFGVFDLPEVAELATKNIEEKGLTERIKVHSGNFFESIPEGYDTITMKSILHDWPNDNCVQILKNCRKVLKPGNRVIILDSLIDRRSPYYNFQLTVDFIMIAFVSARERTVEDFEKLFEASGFKLEIYTQVNYYSIIQIVAY